MGRPELIDEGIAIGADVSDDLPSGTQLLHGQYTIVDFLNAGGFGITYRAKDSLDRKVVIKECFPGAFCRRSRYIVQARSRAHQNEFAGIVRLFVEEARSLSKLVHPNIVGVHQVFEENDTAYMALDFVEGRDLLEILEDPETDLPPALIVSILRDMLAAIGFVHSEGMLHRDISPDNILVGDDLKPVLIDFGAARQQAKSQGKIMSALRVVKDGYSPQEFYITGAEQGPFSDLYALGASFYHLITNEVPPDSQRRLTAIATGDADPYVPLAGRFDDYEAQVLTSIDRALAILPKDRCQTAEEWLADMDAKPAARAISRKIKPVDTTAATGSKKSRAGLIGGVAVLALAAVAGAVVLTGDADPVEEVASAPAAIDTSAVEAAAIALAERSQSITELDATVTPVIAGQSATDGPAAGPETATVVPSSTLEGTASADTPTLESPVPPAPGAEIAASPIGPVFGPPIALAPARPEVLDRPVAALPKTFAPKTSERPSSRPAATPIGTPSVLSDPIALALAGTAPTARPVAISSASAPALPAEQSGAGWSDLPTVKAELPGTEIVPVTQEPDARGLLKGYAVSLPFDGLNGDAEGTRTIIAVNGTPVTDRADLIAVLRSTNDLSKMSVVNAEIELAQAGEAPDVVQNVLLPVVYDVTTSDGVTFRSMQEDGAWVSRVHAKSDGAQTDLEVGDQIFASVDTGTIIEGPTDVQSVIESGIDDGRTTFGLAVMRDGSNWIATFTRKPTN